MIYATKGKEQIGELPRGLIIGTAELYDCEKVRADFYAWKLRNIKLAKKPRAPERAPQPSWFYPFHNHDEVAT